jgi:UDP-2,3-diacylglucosamine hydrolase
MSTPQPSTAPLPDIFEFKAPAAWSAIDFISDLHLTAETPRTFDAWGAHLSTTPADAVFILGDLFDVWVGDDAALAGFEKQCIDVLAEAARHRALGFMVGNRDFLVGRSLLDACGVMALPDPTLLAAFGERVLLSHGDALCIADAVYQRFRAEVRSDAWRDRVLVLPIEQRRAYAKQMRGASDVHKVRTTVEGWADVDADTAVEWLRATGSKVLIHGHTHRPRVHTLSNGCVRHVLSDWDLEDEPTRAEVLRLSAAGLTRVAPSIT